MRLDTPPSKAGLMNMSGLNSSVWINWFNSIYEWIFIKQGTKFTGASSEDTGSRVGTTSSSYTDTNALLDGNIYTLNEASGTTPGATVIFDFSGLKHLQGLALRVNYTGGSSHYYNVEMWNYITSAWDLLLTLGYAYGYSYQTLLLPDASDYLAREGTARVRFNHPPAGNVAHALLIDYVAVIEQGVV